MAKKAKPSISETDIRRLVKFYRLIGSANSYERNNAFSQIFAILKRYLRKWTDLLDLVSEPSTIQNITAEHMRILREQHELLGGSPQDREAARQVILLVLERYRCTWNDLLGFISGVESFNAHPPSIKLIPVPTAPDPLELLTGFIPAVR